ncbi:cytochrome d ubiquinol oxidase subunit II [Rhizobiales bacterium]|uniref:cytochrome d ubiquinol oxidase subunit II n=1 Tax=Hongsoonwoonella zoysiae TaxID=2821844 RepID=UPI0015601023|nr:cytochrome d ubiquinol oxidase subunit II [Hongsoonwoonella zoysiae]NRG16314.1 cytochrome d ubiquinol oxidase subunit II [Hongsoonwoonella zoysiae]
MAIDLPLIWAVLIAVAIFAYVVLDGFDLGVGILFPAGRTESERTLMMNSIAPVWDGNETWLILGGGGLFAVFPLAYSILMPALYAPIIAMLMGLVFRGVVFEFRFKSSARSRPRWDAAFFMGSFVAAFAQGIALGAVVQGVPVEGRAYTGGWFDWLSPFSVMTGLALVSGYALLGATWLIWKTEGPSQQHFRTIARNVGLALLCFIGIVSIWTPLLDPEIFTRWFSYPSSLYTLPVPVMVVAAAALMFTSLRGTRDGVPFLAALVLFLLSYIGLAIGLYPYIVPRSVTIWQAAAPESSQKFLLVGAAVLLPVILAYTAYAYWVFRGKVRPGEGYH